MLTQWECLLKNLGEWQGSFTRLSLTGEIIEDTATMVSLEGLENNTLIHQVVRRFYPDKPPQDLVLDYRSLNRSILFFENGAFSQGSMQWGPFSEFGAEFGLIEQQRRLRIVILFNNDSQLNKITLIREKLANTSEPERPLLTVDQLLGTWQGEATTIYPDLRSPEKYQTHLSIERQGSEGLTQQLTYGEGMTIRSSARIDGSRLLFEESELQIQILLLPDGASINAPLTVKPRHRFVLEMGWLLSPTRRQRIIRSYSEKGEWLGATLVTEEKVR
ncbi:hypothetical protein C7H19_13030 [Aphanothece hegewaldii CCALA 016]|uniref:Uncharacterized protein n=1 Tax=Aphanothece hegewaldii CCALA 016 TaxID=2107694 RepID=A0A2T1LWR4_9CHRO|nr:DUF3598 family protein [Aphanothece hegewaldii]PSF36598.1 hypothetical protein C7H19_13030 [Aphanothece hegewaldii CCALA 016]